MSPELKEAWICGAVRTPVGRHRGALSTVRPDDLGAVAISALLERTGVPGEEIEDVWFGGANQSGEDNRDVARMSLLLAGMPESVAGATVNRLCGSGLEAIASAARAVMLGEAGRLHRRRGRVDEPGAVGDAEARAGAAERPPRGLRHDARMADDEPADGGARPHGPAGRHRREPGEERFEVCSRRRGRATRSPPPTTSRASARTASRSTATRRPSPPRTPGASTTSSSRSPSRAGRGTPWSRPTRARGATPRWRRWPSCRPSSRRAGPSPPATPAR